MVRGIRVLTNAAGDTFSKMSAIQEEDICVIGIWFLEIHLEIHKLLLKTKWLLKREYLILYKLHRYCGVEYHVIPEVALDGITAGSECAVSG